MLSTPGGNTIITGDLTTTGNAVFNENSEIKNFRIESNDETHMFFVDGQTNRISIGDSQIHPPSHLKLQIMLQPVLMMFHFYN